MPVVEGEFRILPYPMLGDGEFHILPIAVGEPHPGGRPAPPANGERPVPDGATAPGSTPRIEIVTGTEGDDRLVLSAGGVARGAGGNDTFVLTSGGATGDRFPERLGYITDFNDGDTLDLSQLGANAKVLNREQARLSFGPDRISIDYDGDGDADGVLLVSSGRTPDLSDYRPMPMPQPRSDLPYVETGDPGEVVQSPPADLAVSFGLVEGWM